MERKFEAVEHENCKENQVTSAVAVRYENNSTA